MNTIGNLKYRVAASALLGVLLSGQNIVSFSGTCNHFTLSPGASYCSTEGVCDNSYSLSVYAYVWSACSGPLFDILESSATVQIPNALSAVAKRYGGYSGSIRGTHLAVRRCDGSHYNYDVDQGDCG